MLSPFGAGQLISRNIFRFRMSSFSGCSLPSDQPLPGETGAALRSAPEPTTGCTGLRLRCGRRSDCAAAQSHDDINRTVFRTLSIYSGGLQNMPFSVASFLVKAQSTARHGSTLTGAVCAAVTLGG